MSCLAGASTHAAGMLMAIRQKVGAYLRLWEGCESRLRPRQGNGTPKTKGRFNVSQSARLFNGPGRLSLGWGSCPAIFTTNKAAARWPHRGDKCGTRIAGNG